jgi:hypothetical protein
MIARKKDDEHRENSDQSESTQGSGDTIAGWRAGSHFDGDLRILFRQVRCVGALGCDDPALPALTPQGHAGPFALGQHVDAGLCRSVQEQQARPIPTGAQFHANLSRRVTQPEHCFTISLYVELSTDSATLVDQLDRPGPDGRGVARGGRAMTLNQQGSQKRDVDAHQPDDQTMRSHLDLPNPPATDAS